MDIGLSCWLYTKLFNLRRRNIQVKAPLHAKICHHKPVIGCRCSLTCKYYLAIKNNKSLSVRKKDGYTFKVRYMGDFLQGCRKEISFGVQFTYQFIWIAFNKLLIVKVHASESHPCEKKFNILCEITSIWPCFQSLDSFFHSLKLTHQSSDESEWTKGSVYTLIAFFQF